MACRPPASASSSAIKSPPPPMTRRWRSLPRAAAGSSRSIWRRLRSGTAALRRPVGGQRYLAVRDLISCRRKPSSGDASDHRRRRPGYSGRCLRRVLPARRLRRLRDRTSARSSAGDADSADQLHDRTSAGRSDRAQQPARHLHEFRQPVRSVRACGAGLDRRNGMPFGITLLAPAGADGMLASIGREFHYASGLPLGAISVPPQHRRQI